MISSQSVCQLNWHILKRFYSSSTILKYAVRPPLPKLRNIGIIAHIDAGKTTTTERLLYCAGKTNRIGNVDHGDTTTDFLTEERERGITIQSAAISFLWRNKAYINLIDTPGHADFTFEVTRSLKVIDGAVVILDAVAGVEAQTEKVWKQSIGIPKVCFINKMDREGAGFSRTVRELVYKLETRCVPITIPFFKNNNVTGEASDYTGVVDIINGKVMIWTDENHPDSVEIHDIDMSSEIYEAFLKSREMLVETLTEYDESIMERFLEADVDGDILRLSSAELVTSIRKLTVENKITPILTGSAFRNIGIQPLLDAISDFLPSPKESRVPNIYDSKQNQLVAALPDNEHGLIFAGSKNLCLALAFKVVTDSIRGTIVFVRIYSGKLKSNAQVYNTTSSTQFRLGKLAIINANKYEETAFLGPGEIGVLTGSTIANNVKTGDTIVSNTSKKDGMRSLQQNNSVYLKIDPISIPQPVVSVPIIPQTLGNKNLLENSLNTITQEDPSLSVTEDIETGQLMLNGMGELHLEVSKHRLVNDFAVKAEFGKIFISYRETLKPGTIINIDSRSQNTVDGLFLRFEIYSIQENKPLNELRQPNETWISLSSDNNYLVIEKSASFVPGNSWNLLLPFDVLVKSLSGSAIAAFERGGKRYHFPLHSCVIRLKSDWAIPKDLDSPGVLLNTARSMLFKSFDNCTEDDFNILEPIMNVCINATSKDLGMVLSDLKSARGATSIQVDDVDDDTSHRRIEFENIAKNMYLPPDPTLLPKLTNTNSSSSMKYIKAQAPLRLMTSYSSKLRSITQGRGEFSSTYSGMSKVSVESLKSII